MLVKRSVLLFFFLIILFTGVRAQTDFRVMFYNVENLFDIHDNPEKDDEDFLPDGFMRWTSWKYREKLKKITKVITAVGEMKSPALVGLCEVENDSVLHDLTKRSPLKAQGYEYIVSNSPDNRGINVALLYQRHQFNLIQKTEYEITTNNRIKKPTRNILHAVGKIINKDTIDVFVTHYPSRSDGQKATEPARFELAANLRAIVDSVLNIRSNPNIIIMGDFNDFPYNKSMSEILKAKDIEDCSELTNLFYSEASYPKIGTYKYQGVWGIFDQFIVNCNLLQTDNSVKVKDLKAYIYSEDFLLEDDTRYYGKKPFRSNLGPRYNGGFSDHLPIYMDLIIKE